MGKIKLGFTLAEILITLSIIGVIASMTIPPLVQDIKDAQLKAAYKKAFATASQAYKMAVIKNGVKYGKAVCTGAAGPSPKWIALKENLNVVKECETNIMGNCWSSSGITPDISTGGCNVFYLAQQSSASRAFVTNDGVYWSSYKSNCDFIAIDVNGARGPNKWGKDAFLIDLDRNSVQPGQCDATGNSRKFLYQ